MKTRCDTTGYCKKKNIGNIGEPSCNEKKMIMFLKSMQLIHIPVQIYQKNTPIAESKSIIPNMG